MPRRPRHLDADLVRRVNPEGENLFDEPPLPMPRMKALLAEPSCLDQPTPRELDARAALKAIGEFVLEYPRDRYGAGPGPVDVGQALALSEALLQAMALLLKREPEQLRRTLEAVVYGDLSEEALAGARKTLGILDRKTLGELLEGVDPGTLAALAGAGGQGDPADQGGGEEPGWVEETMARFPRLFRGIDPGNFECGEGWKDIVAGLCGRLEALARPQLRIVQIKQKFGGLRVYVEGGDDEASALIREAEALAAAACEWCGAPGAKTGDGWILTLCTDCQAKRAREGGPRR